MSEYAYDFNNNKTTKYTKKIPGLALLCFVCRMPYITEVCIIEFLSCVLFFKECEFFQMSVDVILKYRSVLAVCLSGSTNASSAQQHYAGSVQQQCERARKSLIAFDLCH